MGFAWSRTGTQDCFWSREPRGCVALGPAVLLPPDPWFLVRSSVGSIPTCQPCTYTHHRQHRQIRGKSNLDTTWSGSSFRTRTLLPSNNPPLTCSSHRPILHRQRLPSSATAISIQPPVQPVSINPDHDTTNNNHVSILQISVPRPECRKRPIGPSLAVTSPPA